MKKCTCPNCGANLSIKTNDRDFAFCQYCGTKIMLDDYRATHRIIDEAQIKKAENEHAIRLKELEIEESKHTQRSKTAQVITVIWILLSVFVLLSCIIRWAILNDLENSVLMMFCLGVPIVGGGAYFVFGYLPAKEAEKEIIKKGGIKFPVFPGPISSENYIALQSKLNASGFHNIKCVSLRDVKLGLFQKPNMVDSITVNGKEIIFGGKYYMPDVQIVITYHGR